LARFAKFCDTDGDETWREDVVWRLRWRVPARMERAELGDDGVGGEGEGAGDDIEGGDSSTEETSLSEREGFG